MSVFDTVRSRLDAGAGALLAAVAALSIFTLGTPSAAAAAARGSGPAVDVYAPFHGPLYSPANARLPFAGSQHGVCGQASPGGSQCQIHVLPRGTGGVPTAGTTEVTSPYGLAPSTIKTIYGYPTSAEAGAGETIALVDAYNDPDAASNLETFSKEYGLPPADLTQVNQTGGSSLPATQSGWDLEISLDIEWAHAIAPAAHILLVEATTNSLANLLTAENYAGEHAEYVSNSWGASEFSSEASDDSYFTRSGVSYFAAAGDEGSAVIWPSASPDVTSVGGTTVTLTSGGTVGSETVWSGSGGGCSRYESANRAQSTGSASCSGKRATPDVALDANPKSGVSVYDGIAYEGQSGWWAVGGTSASTAMWAATAAVNGTLIDATGLIDAAYIYLRPGVIPFRDITSGSNGHPALTGYDLATGLGAWSYTPGAPGGLTATEEGGQVSLAWSAPTGAPVGEYAIWRGTSSGQETTLLTKVPVSDTSYQDSAISGGGTYYYEVQALNGAGSGPFSAQALAAPPSKPPNAKFTTSCAGATCSFNSTSTDEAGTIDAYAWDGGNGVTGSKSTFSDRYAAAGTYAVSLTVTNTAGQSSKPFTEKVSCVAMRSRSLVSCS
jgi:PKD repeat protein